MADAPPATRRRAAETLLGIAGLAALLFAWRTQAVIGNAVVYCLDAKRGTSLFHPHHVLFNAVIHWLVRGLSALGLEADTIAVAQAHNAVFAAALIGAFAIWLARVRDGRRLGAVELAAPLLLAGSSIFLEFATQPESYVPALACAVGALAVLVDGPGRVRPGRALLAGVLLALAVLYHQIAVVFSLLLLAQAGAAAGARRRPALREAGAAIGFAGAFSLGGYLAAHAASGTGLSFLEYCTWFLQMGQPWGVAGNVGASGLEALGRTLALAAVGSSSGAAGRAALVVAGLLLAANGVAAARGAASRELRLTCLAWAAGLLLFLWWWLPKEVNYYVFVMPPLAALAALSIRDACGERLARPVAIGAAAVVLVWAGIREVLPHHRDPDPVRVRAAALHAIGEPGTVRLCNLATTYWLVYDFDEQDVLHVNAAMAAAQARSAPGGGRSRPHDPLREAPSIVIPLSELRPDLLAAPLAALSPQDPARPWLDFAAWLFDVREQDGQGTRRELAVSRMANGELAVLLWNRRVPCRDMDELLAALDAGIAAQSGGAEEFRFAAWRREAAR